MSSAFGLAGWHFSRNPTSSSSENPVAKIDHSEPWKTGGDAAYQYHPGGDKNKARRDAPSALNEVIIPNVNLPKVSSCLSRVSEARGFVGSGERGRIDGCRAKEIGTDDIGELGFCESVG